MSMDNYPPIKKFTLYTDRQTEVGTNTGFIMDQSKPNIPRMENPPPPPPLTDEGRAWERYFNQYRAKNDYKIKKYEAIVEAVKYLSLAIILSSLFYALK